MTHRSHSQALNIECAPPPWKAQPQPLQTSQTALGRPQIYLTVGPSRYNFGGAGLVYPGALYSIVLKMRALRLYPMQAHILRPQASPTRALRLLPLRYASQSAGESAPSPTVLPWKTPHSITSWPPEPLIPPPKDGEILLERRPNRDLPEFVLSQLFRPQF